MKIPEITFESIPIRLNVLFDRSEELGLQQESFPCAKVREIYGHFALSKPRPGLPLTYASYVMSIDGKIAFEDNEIGPLIARQNAADPNGGNADFWVLNLLRAVADGIIIGKGTLIKEPDYSGSTYDPDLLCVRQKLGMSLAPVTIVVSQSGSGIPWKNQVFETEGIEFIVNTSPKGLPHLLEEMERPYKVADLSKDPEMTLSPDDYKDKVLILVSGRGNQTDAHAFLSALERLGLKNILVESPTYCHFLMQEKLLDEAFINTSGIFVCGQATGLGNFAPSFTSTEHPHAELVSMRIHSPYFYYSRYRLHYDLTP